MAHAELKIITPAKVVFDEPVISVTAPSVEGELTILPKHENYFTLLQEGIVTIRRTGKEDELLAIGGGYLETDGSEITILVSRAYGQDELDQALVERAMDEAQKTLERTKDQEERAKALATLRRSTVEFKLLQRRRRRPAGMGSTND